MTQTLALLLDAYRELNARKMFWISLIISALVMGGFALVGVSDKGISLLWFDLPMPAARFVYNSLFSGLVIGLWVSLGAMVLALISTASIFPDLLASGSIDLYLSKPITRLRLFLTKYVGGLLFVLLQATVFAVGSFIVFGLRAGEWRPILFLIIPLATLLFSYLFAVCVLVGVMTRSTIAAILVTCLFWLLCFVGNTAEQALFLYRTIQSAEARAYERQAQKTERELEELKKRPSVTNVFGFRERRLKQRRDEQRRAAQEAEDAARKLGTAHRIVRGVATVIPKTGETIALLDRKLFKEADLAEGRKRFSGGGGGGPGGAPADYEETSSEVDSSYTSVTEAAEAPAASPATAPTTTAARPASTAPTTAPTEAEVLVSERSREREQRQAVQLEAQEEADRASRSRSIPWIVGTSIGFEAVVLAIAAWIFCRRDY